MSLNFQQRLNLSVGLPIGALCLALAAALWGLWSTTTAFSGFIRHDQALSVQSETMLSQGLQMGQAMRNIVLDPANRRAFDNLEAAREDYDTAYQAATALAREGELAQVLVRIGQLRHAHAASQQRVLDKVKARADDTVAVLNSDETPAWRGLRTELLKLRDGARAAALVQEQAVHARTQRLSLLIVVLALLGVAVGFGMWRLMVSTVRRQIGGDPAQASAALARIARGDLSASQAGPAPEGSLCHEMGRMRSALHDLVGQVRQASDSIAGATSEIATGNLDLSNRTELAAANLQQTAGSMQQLTHTVRESADSAGTAHQLVSSAASVAERGGEVVARVVATMDEINASSRRIADIIGVIDGIAFQTNILALNAAVEAARAGEQGRGFAVVASEVRNLAGRSAEAAREIKQLIGDSVGKVEAGARQVVDAGSTMAEIVSSVQQVSAVIARITGSAAEQRAGIEQVGAAVSSLDQMTQQNAALVEQSAAASASLEEQAQRLAQVVSSFRLQPQH